MRAPVSNERCLAIIIAKQRNGPTGSVHLAYLADFTRFENLERGEPAGY